MGVMLQAFHRDCHRVDNREFAWWTFVRERVPSLARVGLTALWLPPCGQGRRHLRRIHGIRPLRLR